jgi:hypothetical protein
MVQKALDHFSTNGTNVEDLRYLTVIYFGKISPPHAQGGNSCTVPILLTGVQLRFRTIYSTRRRWILSEKQRRLRTVCLIPQQTVFRDKYIKILNFKIYF